MTAAAAPVLRYDAKTNKFWYQHDFSKKISPPMSMQRTIDGCFVTFDNRYPVSLIGCRAYKSAYPSGKATKDALEQIGNINKDKERLAEVSDVVRFEAETDIFAGTKPYEHQRQAIEHMLVYPRTALLLEQGLGKTYISIKALMCLRQMDLPHRALVVCPRIVFQNWLAEIEKFSDFSVQIYKGNPDERREQREAIAAGGWDIILTTFDMLTDKVVGGRATGANKYAGAVLLAAWKDMAETLRVTYVDRWDASNRITQKERAALLSDLSTNHKQKMCASALAKIPTKDLPLVTVQKARLSESSEEFFQNLNFDNLIIDEASRCINHQSKRSKFVETIAANAKRVYLLSGTLCVGKPTDMYQPMQILDPNIFGCNWWTFQKTYCQMSPYNKHVVIGYRNLNLLKLIVDAHTMAKSRAECIDLPDRIITRRYYEPTDEMIGLYNGIVEQQSVTLGKHVVYVPSVLTKIMKCMQVLNGFVYVDPEDMPCNKCEHVYKCVANNIRPTSSSCVIGPVKGIKTEAYPLKTNPKLELLEEDLEDCGDEKVIIWAWYQYDIDSIRKLLERKHISYVLAGTEGCDKKFESDKRIKVFLGQTVQGIGITLNSATTTIYYSHGAALEPRLQSMDRNYRIGQTKSVVVKDYLSYGTIESSLVSLLEHKADVKDFMQQRMDCLCCDNCEVCIERGTKFLEPGCVYHGMREEAESKRTLRLRTIGEQK